MLSNLPTSSFFTLDASSLPFWLKTSSISIPPDRSLSRSQSIHSPYDFPHSASSFDKRSERANSSNSRLLPHEWHQMGSAPTSPSIRIFAGVPVTHSQFIIVHSFHQKNADFKKSASLRAHQTLKKDSTPLPTDSSPGRQNRRYALPRRRRSVRGGWCRPSTGWCR